MQNAVSDLRLLTATSKDSDLRRVAEGFYNRLHAAGLQSRQKLSIVTHLIAMLTDSLSHGNSAASATGAKRSVAPR